MSLIALALAAALQTSAQAAAAPKSGCRIGLIADLPVTFERNQPTVSVEIDGKPVKALIDTGAATSLLFLKAAQRIGLPTRDLPGVRMFGVDGETRALAAHIGRFSLMGASSKGFDIAVARSTSDTDMLIGEDLLSLVDLEFDLGNGKLKLVRTNNCADDELAYWAKDSYSEAAFVPDAYGKPQVTVKLNGVSIRAVLDSGASISLASDSAAFQAGVTLPAQAAGHIMGVGGQGFARRTAVVKSVSIGDETVGNAPLSFGPLYRNQETTDTGSRIQSDTHVDMYLGADFLRSHHVLVSRSRSRLYFTYNGGPVFRQEAAPASGKQP